MATTYKVLPTLILYHNQLLGAQYNKISDSELHKPMESAKTTDQLSKPKEEIPITNQYHPLQFSARKKYPKDDYQKNITINVVKCCIRELLSKNYERKLKKMCLRMKVSYEELRRLVEPILKEVVISLGDLKKLLTTGEQEELRLKKVFGWFLEWYLRHKYMYYLLVEGKMNFKERYIEYKNKFMLYLLVMIREERKGLALAETPCEQVI